MELNLSGKVAFITGAATGIGRETALEFARSGASVGVVDWNETEGKETQQLIESMGGKALFIRCDVGDEASVSSAVSETVKHFGGLHLAFNNAGIGGTQGSVADLSLDNWNQVVQINLTGVFLCMKYQIPEILKSGGGSIVNCSSILGTVGFAGASAYVAAKHGVVGLTQTAALEYATQGIRVNSIGPGFILTPMLEKAGISSDQATRTLIESLHPMNRLGKSEEISSLVVYLCSERASFITGQHIHADGGYTTR
jgi:NAD(P)-dependent dehydrogenase (short-subunit alcohol dehydrogenase family)